MNKVEYQAYLRTPHWTKIRQLTLDKYWRKGCRICRSRKNLNVHHRTYRNLGNETPGRDTTVLCNDCHLKVHIATDGTKTRLTWRELLAREEQMKPAPHLHRRKPVKLSKRDTQRYGWVKNVGSK